MANLKPPTSVREEGLRQHVGDEIYTELVKRFELNEPVSIIARAVRKSRPTIYHYRDIYNEENGLTK